MEHGLVQRRCSVWAGGKEGGREEERIQKASPPHIQLKPSTYIHAVTGNKTLIKFRQILERHKHLSFSP